MTSRIQILERRLRRGDPVGDTVARLRTEVAAMNEVITDLLQAAEAAQAAGPATADIAPAITAAVATLTPLAAEVAVAVQVRAPAALTVRMPPVTLRRVYVALIDNAIVHSPAGGTVRVTAVGDGHDVVVRVADEGTGIADADVARVFDRFAHGPETGRRRGFGLGLALVQEAVTRSGGRVDVESTSPAGTVFRVTLPGSSAFASGRGTQ